MAQRKFTLEFCSVFLLSTVLHPTEKHLKIKPSGKIGEKGEAGMPGAEKPLLLKYLGKALLKFLIKSSITPSFLASVLL